MQNASTDLSADLSVSTTNNNTEYFIISSQLAKSTLTAGEATTVTVEIELTKTPITASVSATVGVQLTSVPVQPGEEGSSGTTNDFSQTPVRISNNNIGDYIDLGNNIVGTTSTKDDWRILYKDESRIYAILADYLPADQVPTSAGLNTNVSSYPYGVWSNTNRDTLINGLLNTSAWSSFANGISGATATGSPTAELLMSSYNTKNGTNLDYTTYPILDSSTEDYDLYVPHTSVISNCYSYWLASPYAGNSYYVWRVSYDGDVSNDYYHNDYRCARPVVSLSSDTQFELVDGVWEIKLTITNANIGDYIDLGNNIVGTTSTKDDWRILYKDENRIYVILADYLPADQVPTAAGLNTNVSSYPYGVWSNTNRDTLINGLLNETAWNSFANGISGATATGSPTAELLMSSYNTKNGTNLDYTTYPTLDSSTENYDLYVPHTSSISNCYGYWLASPYAGAPYYVWNVYASGYVNRYDYNANSRCARPVVSLSSDIQMGQVDGVWEIR